MRIQIEDSGTAVQRGGAGVFFASGFRPFFLFAGVQAAVSILGWVLVWFGLVELALPFAPTVWHGHEMVFGFAAAALAGFLLTAVPNWTGVAPVGGGRLVLLFAVWLAARIGFWFAAVVPPVLLAVVDLAFLPLLGAMLAVPLIRAGKLRNIIFLPILAVLALADLCVHLELIGLRQGSAATGILLGIYVLILMITIVGGRIIPSFTANALRMRRAAVAEPASHPWLERGLPFAVIVAALADLAMPGHPLAGAVALAVGLLQLARMKDWRSWHTRQQPILWILHVGYAWVGVAFLLRGLSAFTAAVPPTAALHAFTAGAVATMILAVMTRAALGHAGRPLLVAPATVVAYVLVVAAGVTRVFLPLLVPASDASLAPAVSGLLWVAGFATYAAVYLPIFTQPRADGRPG